VRLLRWLAWLWTAATGIVLVGSAVTVGYRLAVDEAATYGRLVDVVQVWRDELHAWMWASWVGLVVAVLSFVAFIVALAVCVGAHDASPGPASTVMVRGFFHGIGRSLQGGFRYVTVAWMALSVALVIHVLWVVLAVRSGAPVVGSSLTFVSADTGVGRLARSATIAASDAAKFPVRGAGGFSLLLLSMMTGGVLLWRVRKILPDGDEA
jgi:hypothetical protein